MFRGLNDAGCDACVGDEFPCDGSYLVDEEHGDVLKVQALSRREIRPLSVVGQEECFRARDLTTTIAAAREDEHCQLGAWIVSIALSAIPPWVTNEEMDSMESAVLVRDVMTSNVKTVRPDDSLREVIEKMVRFHIGCVVVVQEKRPVGIVTERDVLVRLSLMGVDMDTTRAKDLMSSPVLTIGERRTIEEASRLMTQKNVKKLAVTRDDELIGIVTGTDVMRSAPKLTDLFEEMRWIWRQREQK
jgi:CBS domain-containing protein